MKNALDDINAAFTKSTGIKVTASYAASSALMKQIEQGAPADVFASADLDWMDYGSQKKVINDKTRINLLGNRLVLIAPKDSKLGNVTIGSGFNLAQLAGGGRIATGDVRAVPVGIYAKAALEKLGSWQAAAPKFAMTENVRAALTLVARGEAPLGIVYATDAIIEPRVKIIGVFPADSHPEIIYPVAATVTAKPEALDDRFHETDHIGCHHSFLVTGISQEHPDGPILVGIRFEPWKRPTSLPFVFALSGCEGGIRAIRLRRPYPAEFLMSCGSTLS
jgi:molybdate transport system substrate-binding protein